MAMQIPRLSLVVSLNAFISERCLQMVIMKNNWCIFEWVIYSDLTEFIMHQTGM